MIFSRPKLRQTKIVGVEHYIWLCECIKKEKKRSDKKWHAVLWFLDGEKEKEWEMVGGETEREVRGRKGVWNRDREQWRWKGEIWEEGKEEEEKYSEKERVAIKKKGSTV